MTGSSGKKILTSHPAAPYIGTAWGKWNRMAHFRTEEKQQITHLEDFSE